MSNYSNHCKKTLARERIGSQACDTCAGGKLAMKLVFVGGWDGAADVMAMICGVGEGMAIETGVCVIMGCWCWGITGAMAIVRDGRLGTGGEGNWLRISTFIAGRPLWNKGDRFQGYSW